MKINESHIGKRIILSKPEIEGMFETIIDEISPSENLVKFNGTWHQIDKYTVVEVLNESKKLLLD